MKYRINGFDQIKQFYSVVFEQKYQIKPQHISLYIFLINQNNRNNWVEWFKCPFDLAMSGACIGSKSTYYKCLSDLQEWKFIKYEKGINDWKAPRIKIEVLNCTSTSTATVPQSEPLPEQVPTPQSEPLPEHIYKLITSNLKLITSNFIEFEKLVKKLSKKKSKRKEEISPDCRKYFLDYFLKEKGVEFYWSPAESVALNQLIAKIRHVSGGKSDDETKQLFYLFVDKIKVADSWVFDNLSVRVMNQKFNEIVPKMKKVSSSGSKQNVPNGYEEMMNGFLKTLNDE